MSTTTRLKGIAEAIETAIPTCPDDGTAVVAFREIGADVWIPLWGSPATVAAAVMAVVGPVLAAEIEKAEGYRVALDKVLAREGVR